MKKKYFIGIIVIILAVVFVASGKLKKPVDNFFLGATGGITGKTSSLGKKTKNFFSLFSDISSYRKQNAELTEKLNSLQVDQSKTAELEHENELLKNELGYVQENKNYSLIPSKIIGRDPTNFLDEITVDNGKNEGILPGMAVLSAGTLVGQVKEVFDQESKITLITSKDSVVLAMLQTSRSKGILRGGISGLVLEDITNDLELKSNDYVITSGLDGRLPQGILIGRAGDVKSSSSDLFKNISVEPIVDISKLEMVFIQK